MDPATQEPGGVAPVQELPSGLIWLEAAEGENDRFNRVLSYPTRKSRVTSMSALNPTSEGVMTEMLNVCRNHLGNQRVKIQKSTAL